MSAASNQPKRALGKGLSALLPNRPEAAAATESEPGSGLLHLSIEQIEPNPLQPRAVFQADRLNELAQSIRENGIIQPLVVRKAGDRFQLIAGERRWRAARLAGLDKVPVVVQEFAEDRLMEVALVENIQREDLNPIEVAQAFERLNKQFKLSHEQIAQRTGKDRTTVTNLLRLLKLPGDIQILLAEHRLSTGHARALLGLEDPEAQIEVAGRITSEGLSVRQVERLVQRMNEPREAKPAEEAVVDPNVRAAIQELERKLGTRVRIVPKSEQRGRIEIEYYSIDDLTRIYEMIVGE
ncbi:MAG: ParB/RepB/Spo0J family partition protein [Bryobacteraceae bacterium]|nr:ParB/RepB/Spo0J family partition protein [Solibacteraceae bacterium]MCL4840753.1 ParB/RepB/Spo0J family partition protein [Bryobacteraceae bacterium]MCO5352821.1 ParB/RepB/Spo0J family partition protein [Bryobacteraceae bacterium]